MNRHVDNVLYAMVCKLLPTKDLLESKQEYEEYLALAKEDEIEASEEDILYSEKSLARINRVLARRGNYEQSLQ